MGDKVDFLPVDKHESLLQRLLKRQSFLQIDTIILGVCGQACPNYPK